MAQSISGYTSMTIQCAWSKWCPAQPATEADVGIGTQVCAVNVSQGIVPSTVPWRQALTAEEEWPYLD